MDWAGLLRNRWALAGVGAAALLGGVVWWRRHHGTTASSSTGAGLSTASPGYASGAVGGFDSTGTDVAHWLGEQSGLLQNQFNEFQRNVTDQLAAIPTGTTGTGAPTPASNPAPTLPRTLSAPANTNLYNWSQQIEATYGLTTPVFSKLSGYKWGSPAQFGADPRYGNVPYFTVPTTVVLA